jgi:ABC-type lipopolysaccharide export system ATPase subunit
MGLVSMDVPLISSLNVGQNIALIRLYHVDESKVRARKRILRLLNLFHKMEIADLQISALDHWERFLVKLLRAAMVQDAFIVIDRPFRLVPDLPDAKLIQDSLKQIDELYSSCQIFDYSWNRGRYRIDDVSES